jgi:hypothetical protein
MGAPALAGGAPRATAVAGALASAAWQPAAGRPLAAYGNFLPHGLAHARKSRAAMSAASPSSG